MGSRKKSWPFYCLVLTSSQTMPCDCNQKYESLVLIFLSWHYSLRKVMGFSLKLPWGNFSQRVYFWRFSKLYTGTFCLQKKRVSEDEMAGWHHWCNGHELGQTSGDGEGQRGLACCSPWGRKESDTAGQLNNSSNIIQETCVQSLKSRECCGLEALVLLIVFDHVPYFNFTKMLVGFSEAIFCGNSGLETYVPCPQMIFCLWWSCGVILRIGRKWLPRSEFDRHLRDSDSQQLFPEMSQCI